MLKRTAYVILAVILTIPTGSVLAGNSEGRDAIHDAREAREEDQRVAMAGVARMAGKEVFKRVAGGVYGHFEGGLSMDPGEPERNRIFAHQENVHQQMERAIERSDLIEQDRQMKEWERLEKDWERSFDIREVRD